MAYMGKGQCPECGFDWEHKHINAEYEEQMNKKNDESTKTQLKFAKATLQQSEGITISLKLLVRAIKEKLDESNP